MKLTDALLIILIIIVALTAWMINDMTSELITAIYARPVQVERTVHYDVAMGKGAMLNLKE